MDKSTKILLAVGSLSLLGIAGLYFVKNRRRYSERTCCEVIEFPKKEAEEYEEVTRDYIPEEKVEEPNIPDLEKAKAFAKEALNKPLLHGMEPRVEEDNYEPTGFEIISPEEIPTDGNYDDDDWDCITLTWFDDGVMLDDEGQEMPEYWEAVGRDFVNHFEGNECAVKNYDRKLYYDILLAGQCYYTDDPQEGEE